MSRTFLIFLVLALSFLTVFGVLSTRLHRGDPQIKLAVARNACRTNRRLLQNAKQIWVQQGRKAATDIPSDSELFGAAPALFHTRPICPLGGAYIIGPAGELSRCGTEQLGIRWNI